MLAKRAQSTVVLSVTGQSPADRPNSRVYVGAVKNSETREAIQQRTGDKRESTEAARVEADKQLATGEIDSIRAELLRVANETDRRTAERLRGIAEELQYQTEQLRRAAELVRVAGDSSRQAAETARTEADRARVQADRSSQCADEARQCAVEARRSTRRD